MSIKNKVIIFSIFLPAISCIYGILSKHGDIIMNSLLTILCILVFIIIHKKFPYFKDKTYCAFLIFILLSVFAGRTLKIYMLIPHWDKILHFLSGFIFASAGSEIYIKLDGNCINRRLISFFAVIFAIAAACVWEIYEFSIDKILNMSSQNGLNDTMWDMIAGTISAIIKVAVTDKILKL